MASRSERYNVELTAEDKASQVINDVAEAREKLSDEPVVVDITAEDEASETIGEVTEAAETLDGTEAEVDLAADDEASEVVDDVATATEELDGAEAEVELAADDEASGTIEDVSGALGDLDGESATADIDVTGDDESTVTDVTDALGELDGEEASADIMIEGDDESAVTDVTDALGDLDGESATADLTVEGDDASDVTEVTDALGELDGDEATADIEVTGDDESTVTDVSDALEDLDGMDASASMEVDGSSTAAEAVGEVIGGLETLKAGVLTAAATAGLTSVFSGAADHVLDVQNLATATGDTLTNATGVLEAFDFVGVSASKLESFVGRVNDKLGESPEIADQLGITIDENKTPLENFIAVVDALNSSQLTANERLSLATDIFGRRGAIAVLAVGTQVGKVSEQIENMPEWQAVTQSDVDAAIEFKETMDELGDLAEEAAQQFLVKFGPAVTRAFELATDLGTAIGDLRMAPADSPIAFLEALDDAAFEEVTQNFVDLGGNYEHLLQNSLDLKDATALLDLGIPPEVIASAELTGGAYDALGQSMAETEATAAALHQAFVDGKVSQDEWKQATADGVITMAEVKAAIDDTDVALAENVTAVDEAAAAAAAHEAAVEAQKGALEDEISVLEDSIEAHQDQAEAVADAASAWLSEREAIRNAEDAVDDYHEALQPVEEDTRTAAQVTRDQEAALDKVVESYVDVADAAVATTREQRTATGATLSDIEALDIHNASLITQAGTLQGAEKQALLEHTLRINGIPEERITTIFTDNDPNDIAQVEAELNNASRSRQALMQAIIDEAAKVYAEGQLDNIARTRYATIVANVINPAVSLFGQHGSPHTTRGRYLVGEAGPEVVEMPEGAVIHPTERTGEMLGGGGGGDTYNQTNIVHLPAGTPTSTMKLFRRYDRRNGKLNGVVT